MNDENLSATKALGQIAARKGLPCVILEREFEAERAAVPATSRESAPAIKTLIRAVPAQFIKEEKAVNE